MENKREGGVGDIWYGIFGENHAESLMKLMPACMESKKALAKYYDKYASIVYYVDTLPVQTVLQKTEDETLLFLSMFPKFPTEFKNMSFEVEKIDEWANGAEAVFIGYLFGERKLAFFCQNYLDYKEINLIGKKININISIIGSWAELLPAEERTLVTKEGPFKGKELSLNSLRYLSPIEDEKPEMSEFFFPIQGIEKSKFMETDVYKVKGVITSTDEAYEDYSYNVYINSELIKKPELLKLEEPLVGQGVVIGEIIDVIN